MYLESEDENLTKKTRKVRKLFAGVLTLAMILTSVVWPQGTKKVSAADPLTIDESKYDATSVLTAKGDTLNSTKNTEEGGDIQSNKADKVISAKYLKITYTIADTTNLTTDSNLFVFKPFTSGFGGWQDNLIKFKDAIRDGETTTYTSYIKVRDIKASMELDQECYGINLYFAQKAVDVTLTGYYAMTVKNDSSIDYGNEEDVVVWEDPETKTGYGGHDPMQKLYLSQITGAGDAFKTKYDYSKVSSQKITVYLQVTKSSVFSRIKISGGKLTEGSESVTSNKE